MRKQILAVTIGVLLVLSVFSVLQFWQIKPVLGVDSTFGYTTMGTGYDLQVNQTRLIGTNFTLSTAANLTSMTAGNYISEYAVSYQYAIYDNNFNLIAYTNTGSGPGGVQSWLPLNFSTWHVINAGQYFLCAWTNVTSWAAFYRDAGDASQSFYQTGVAYNSWPSTLSPTAYTNYQFSIYANYTSPDNFYLTDISSNETVKNNHCSFNATAHIISGNVSGYIFGTNNSGSWVNETWVDLGCDALTEIVSVDKILNSTSGNIVQSEYWFNDTSNNWINSGLQALTTTDPTPPAYNWNSVWVNSTSRSSTALFTVKWRSISGTLDSFIFEHNNTGTLTNTTTAFAGGQTEAWSNVTLNLNSTYTTMFWRMYANNSIAGISVTLQFSLNYATVTPWHYTNGNKIYTQDGIEYIPKGVDLVWCTDTPTLNFERKGQSGTVDAYFNLYESGVTDNLQALELQGFDFVTINVFYSNWQNNYTLALDGTQANVSGQYAWNRILALAEPYNISFSIRIYSVNQSEGRVLQPYPPYSTQTSFISSRNDFIDKYLAIAKNLSVHPNVWFLPFDEPTEDFTTLYGPTIANLTMQMRGCGLQNIFQIQWGYCGEPSYWSNWIANDIYMNITKNVVLSPHIYRFHGSFGTGGGSDPQDPYTYLDVKTAIQTSPLNYNYYHTTLNAPMFVSATGSYDYSNTTKRDIEEQAFNNTLEVLNEMEIGWNIYAYQRSDTGFLTCQSGYSIRYPNNVTLYGITHSHSTPFSFSVGNETVTGISGYYIFSNNTSWSSTWGGNQLTVTYTGATQVRVFWNVSNTYPMNSSLYCYHSNGTYVLATDFYDATINLICLNSTASGTWTIGYTFPSGIEVVTIVNTWWYGWW